ncbi:hypothetical protein EIP86_010513 [Pleurotus ostreatoroseus]|nr:hypothetical protein EIP86_010513 [Pleurotus ostreatoroseus]
MSFQGSMGLGIDVEEGFTSKPYPSDVELLSRAGGPRVRRALTGPRAPSQRRAEPQSQSDFIIPVHMTGPGPVSSLARADSVTVRSERAMEGLKRAELGDAMVAFDVTGEPLKEGSRFALDSITPRGGTVPHRRFTRPTATRTKSSFRTLPRDCTILDFRQSHTRNAAELKTLLGNSNAKLKSGAAVPPTVAQKALDKKTRKEQTVTLEQARSRARVEVDLVLQSNVLIQGGYVRGHVKVRIRRRGKKDSPLLLAEGKVRIVGFETLSSDDERHAFYQFATTLSAITENHRVLFDSEPDEDGFAEGAQGTHILPFCFQLPGDGSFGTAKGVVNMPAGISVRYIAMISMKVRDPDTGKRSLAHFYRNCEVWPHLDPSTVLRPAPRPLQASTAKNITFLGGSTEHRVKLSAQLPRLQWAAGTRCPVMLSVQNGSKKTIRALLLTLVRTTTLFRPKPMLDADGDRDPDSCQTATSHKVMAESLLEMSAGVTKGHASAKGWWTGIAPGQDMEFSHYIVLPPEILSITRSRLVEVEYSIRVTISAGSLTPDVSVTLPIRIFNFISIDPPPSTTMPPSAKYSRFSPMESQPQYTTLPPSDSMLDPSISTCAVRASPGSPPIGYPTSMSHTSFLHVTNPDIEPPPPPARSAMVPAESEVSMSMYSADSGSDEEDDGEDEAERRVGVSGSRVLSGVLELDEDAGSDEEVAAVVRSVRVDQGQFASIHGQLQKAGPPHNETFVGGGAKVKAATVGAARGRKQWGRPQMEGVGAGAMGMSSFARRVQEKRRIRAQAALRSGAGAGPGAGVVVRDYGFDGGRRDDAAEWEEDPEPDEEIPPLGYDVPSGSTQHGRYAAEYTSHPSSQSHIATDGIPSRPSRQLPRPPSGSAFASTRKSNEGSRRPGLPASASSASSILEPSYHTDVEHVYSFAYPNQVQQPPPPLPQPQPTVLAPSRRPHRTSPVKPTHTFIPHSSRHTASGFRLPDRPFPNPRNHNPNLDAHTLPGLPHPPTVPMARSAYPSDPERLREEILRPPRHAMPAMRYTRSAGSDDADGVRGRVAALEERVHAARVSGEGWY